MPSSTAVPVKWGGPWAKCSEASWFGSCAGDGRHGLPSAPLALKPGVLAKQNIYQGTWAWVAGRCSGQCYWERNLCLVAKKNLTCLGTQLGHPMPTERNPMVRPPGCGSGQVPCIKNWHSFHLSTPSQGSCSGPNCSCECAGDIASGFVLLRGPPVLVGFSSHGHCLKVGRPGLALEGHLCACFPPDRRLGLSASILMLRAARLSAREELLGSAKSLELKAMKILPVDALPTGWTYL
eukprot:1025336-Pelagomonas_calceolata.AAC.2